jgi:translation initiation factor IF-2
VSRIKALKTPQVLKEMRVKGLLMDHKEIKAAMGVKVVAPGLEMAVAGTSMFVVGGRTTRPPHRPCRRPPARPPARVRALGPLRARACGC